MNILKHASSLFGGSAVGWSKSSQYLYSCRSFILILLALALVSCQRQENEVEET